jgi:hypothetical protein
LPSLVVAVMMALPMAFALTMPYSLTVATAALLVSHIESSSCRLLNYTMGELL